ncbi:MAG: hypothetical protein ACLSVD_06380 [Eggerthellaceae bacterium]
MCESTLSALPPVAFVIVALVCYFLIACLIPSSTGLAAATMGIMAALSQFAGVDVAIMVTIYCMALGLAKMISPTSIVVMTCTSAAHELRRLGEARRSHRGLPVPGVLRVPHRGRDAVTSALPRAPRAPASQTASKQPVKRKEPIMAEEEKVYVSNATNP